MFLIKNVRCNIVINNNMGPLFLNMGIKTKGIKSAQHNYCSNEDRGFTCPYQLRGYVFCTRFILQILGKSSHCWLIFKVELVWVFNQVYGKYE